MTSVSLDTLNNLIEQYQKYKFFYYNTSKTFVTDAEFDALEDKIRSIDPNHPCLTAVGAPISSGRTIPLPYWMSSLDKFYPEDMGLSTWISKLCVSENKSQLPCFASAKLDGVSGLLIITKNEKMKLYSRGNGTIGSDWSHHLPFIADSSKFEIPPEHDKLIIRGELIISKKDFETFGSQYTTGRAMVTGLLGATRNIKPELIKYIQFIGYAVYEPIKLSLYEQWKLIHRANIKSVDNIFGAPAVSFLISPVLLNIVHEQCKSLFYLWRQNAGFETDGVVVHCALPPSTPCTEGNPTNAFAYKVKCNDQNGITNVIKVDWNVSKDGFLKPTVIVEPFCIHGVTIKKTSGFNAKFILENKIGPGAVVQISRRGDVIPTIDTVIRYAPDAQFPVGSYCWTNSNVDIMLLSTDLEENVDYKAKKLAFSFKIMDIPNASISVARRLISANLCTDFLSVINLKVNDLIKVNGFAKLSAQNLIDEINIALKKAKPCQWLAAGHVFGRSIGPKKLQQILNVIDLDTISEEHVDRQKLMSLSGFELLTVEKVLKCLPEARKYWKTVCDLVSFDKEDMETKVIVNPISDSFVSKKILITGFRCKTLSDYISKKGHLEVSTWTPQIELVIRKDDSYSNTKIEKAIKHGTPLISQNNWESVISNYV